MNQKQLLLITLFLTLFSLSIQQDCVTFGERVTLGDYFTSKDDSNEMISVALNTKDKCDNLLLNVKIGTDTIIQLKPFTSKVIDTASYTNNVATYKIYSYYFQVGAGQNLKEGMNFEYFSSTNPAVFKVLIPYHKDLAKDRIDNLLVYGDYDANVQDVVEDHNGKQTHEYFTKQLTTRTDFNQVIFLGDMAYDLLDDNYGRSEKFFKKVSPYYGSFPQINTYGNHESGGKQEGFGYKFVTDYFRMPNYDSGKNRDFHFYSLFATIINFDAQLIWYDGAKPEKATEVQAVVDQLKAQLQAASANRDKKPWIIVYSHYPIYYTDDEDNSFDKKRTQFQKIEDLINEFKVDLYISAHVHTYQRYVPLKNGVIAEFESPKTNTYHKPQAPLYVVEGRGGKDKQSAIQTIKTRDAMAGSDQTYAGAAYLKIYNSTHLNYKHFRTLNGVVVDDFWITKEGKKESSTDQSITQFSLLLFVVLMVFSILN